MFEDVGNEINSCSSSAVRGGMLCQQSIDVYDKYLAFCSIVGVNFHPITRYMLVFWFWWHDIRLLSDPDKMLRLSYFSLKPSILVVMTTISSYFATLVVQTFLFKSVCKCLSLGQISYQGCRNAKRFTTRHWSKSKQLFYDITRRYFWHQLQFWTKLSRDNMLNQMK